MENENSVNNTGSVINASNTLTIKSGNDTTINGSQAKGEKVEATIGGNLNIASLQDSNTYKANNTSIGFDFNNSTGSFNKDKTNSTYDSVINQAGIFAGKDGFDINVGKNTDLKGAVIASEAEPIKNALSTGTLTFANMENRAKYDATSTGFGISLKDGKLGMPTMTPEMPANGDANSTTKSAVALGTIEVRSNPNQDLSGLSRDPSGTLNALGKIFDKKTVEEQRELSTLFGQEAFKLVGDIAQKYQKEKFDIDIKVSTLESEAKKADENGNVEEANKLRNQVVQLKVKAEELSIWNEGGKAKIALHALVGGIMSTMGSGSFATGALSAGINESLQNEINKLPIELRSLGSAVIGTAVSEVVGGDGQSGATITTSAYENNNGPHAWFANELKNIVFGTTVDLGISWVTGEDFDLMQSILDNSSAGDVIQVCAKLKSGDYIGAMEHTIALGSNIGFGKNAEKVNEFSEKIRKYKGSSKAIEVPGRVQSRINLRNGSSSEGAGWEHVVDRHFNPTKNASQFTVMQEELRGILQSESVINTPVTRTLEIADGIRYVREINLDKTIGIDKFSGQPTSIMTVLTDKFGNLVTATPGVIK